MDAKKPNQQEMLAAIAEAVRRKQAGEDPYNDPQLRRSLPPQEFPQPNIAPPKPDPEAAANRMIQIRVNTPVREGEQSPEAVMREGEAVMDPAAAQEAERRNIRMQMLQEAAKTGQMPSYLKKY